MNQIQPAETGILNQLQDSSDTSSQINLMLPAKHVLVALHKKHKEEGPKGASLEDSNGSKPSAKGS